MYKLLFFCFISFLVSGNSCFAQVPAFPSDTLRVIEIIEGKSLREKSLDSVNKIQTIAGNVLIREGFTKFSCDSAIINRKLNTIEAFGNVHINDADSMHTYSQYLKYFGDQRVAHLTKNVRLTDGKGTLLTQDLTYDLSTGIGTYNTGGKIINGSTILTSKNGIYYADTKDVFFKNNVDLTDPKYKIKADSLLYNTRTQVVTFIGPTDIKSKEADIYTTQGYYDLKNGNAFFGTRSLVTDSSGRIYQANKIAIDEKSGLAELEGRAVIKDSVNGIIVTANHIYLNNKNSSFLAVNKPVMIIQQEKDSIYISADTLFSGFTTGIAERVLPAKVDSVKIDSVKDNRPADTSFAANNSRNIEIIHADTLLQPVTDSQNAVLYTRPALSDTLKPDSINKKRIVGFSKRVTLVANTSDSARADFTGKNLSTQTLTIDTLKQTKNITLNKKDTAVRYFLAFHHVRIFNDSLQSVCDSLFFSAKDSVFRLFYEPVVWSGQSQITGDTIFLYTKNKKPERLYVFDNGMVVNKTREEFYNQIAGKTINGYFKNGQIDYARVKGQKAESIYYIQDKDSAYIGANNATGDVIDMYFLNSELNKVKFVNDVSGTMYPMKQIPEDKTFLKNFEWLDKRRPKNKLELFE
jgi:lipopolysaccharide export system protein LptA